MSELLVYQDEVTGGGLCLDPASMNSCLVCTPTRSRLTGAELGEVAIRGNWACGIATHSSDSLYLLMKDFPKPSAREMRGPSTSLDSSFRDLWRGHTALGGDLNTNC